MQFVWRFYDVLLLVSYIHKQSPYHNTDSLLLQYHLTKSDSNASINSNQTLSNTPKPSSSLSSKFTVLLYVTLILFRVYTFMSTSPAEDNNENIDDVPNVDSVSNSSSQSRTDNRVPYPKKPDIAPGCIVPPIESDNPHVSSELCPICREVRVDPCVSSGGYVFCFSCLYEYTTRHNKCPVSGYYCSPSEIIRLYMKT